MKNEEILQHASMKKLLLSLCVPSVIITLVMIIYNMSDVYFIAQTNDVSQIAAISLASPIFALFQGLATLLGSGGSIAISYALGRKDYTKLKGISSFCYYASIFLGVIILIVTNVFCRQIAQWLGASNDVIEPTMQYIRILSYGSIPILFASIFANLIRSDGSAKQAMLANIIGTFINIALNPILISTLNLGICGAGIATVIGNICTCGYLLYYSKKQQPNFSFKWADCSGNSSIVRELIPLGIPLALSTFLTSFSNVFTNNLYGGYGDIIIAANGVSSMIGMMLSMVAMGLCMGVQPAISHCYGAKNFARMKQIIVSTSVLSVAIGSILSLVCFLFRSNIMNSFIDDSTLIEYGLIMMLSSIVVGPFYGIYQMCSTFLQSTKKVNYASILSLLPKALILVPTILIMKSYFGLYGLIFSSSLANIISTLIGLMLALKWYKEVTSNAVIKQQHSTTATTFLSSSLSTVELENQK